MRRIVYLLFRPAAEWDRIAGERTTVDALLRAYILPLAALAPIATIIGMTTFDREWDAVHGYLVPADQIFASGATTFFGIIASIFALAAIFTFITPMFGAPRNFIGALKVATYGAIPMMLAGALLVLPVMVIVGLVAACHSAYLYWLGVRRVLDVPAGAGSEFVGVSLVLLALVSVFIGALASAVGLI